MPMFDYKCPSCGTEYKDKLVKFSDSDSQYCDKETVELNWNESLPWRLERLMPGNISDNTHKIQSYRNVYLW